MRRFRFGWIMVLMVCILLCGCGNRRDSAIQSLNLTEKISIDCYYRDNHLLRTYTDSDKIDVILKYLHELSPNAQISQQPEQADGDRCNITIYLSNGTTRSYDLQGKEYLRKNQGAWYSVDPQKANIIYHLVNHIESDKK